MTMQQVEVEVLKQAAAELEVTAQFLFNSYVNGVQSVTAHMEAIERCAAAKSRIKSVIEYGSMQ